MVKKSYHNRQVPGDIARGSGKKRRSSGCSGFSDAVDGTSGTKVPVRRWLPIGRGLCYNLMTYIKLPEATLVRWLFRTTLPILVCCTLFGAEHYGYVRSGKRPIPGATVTATLDKLKLVTTTDENGIYIFDIPDRGKWLFEAEMFGFTPVKEERTLSGAASVLDFDLELQAGGAVETPEAATAPGFQTVDVKETDGQAQIEQQMEAVAAPVTPSMGGSDINEALTREFGCRV